MTPLIPAAALVAEVSRVTAALADVMEPEAIPVWLNTPNHYTRGLTPLDLIAQGRVDRVMRCIYFMGSGMPV